MYGIYLKCESCEATIGGHQVTSNPEPPLHRTQSTELRRRAAERGWVSSGERDWCPQHNPTTQQTKLRVVDGAKSKQG